MGVYGLRQVWVKRGLTVPVVYGDNVMGETLYCPTGLSNLPGAI